jgi:hypothetical protein
MAKNDLKLAVESSQKLESLLECNYSATGRGLHEKIASVEDQLPVKIVRGMRFIASVRNAVVHEVGARIEDREGFLRKFQEAQQFLSSEGGHANKRGNVPELESAEKSKRAKRRVSTNSWEVKFGKDRRWGGPILGGVLFFISIWAKFNFVSCVVIAALGAGFGFFFGVYVVGTVAYFFALLGVLVIAGFVLVVMYGLYSYFTGK